MSIYTIRARQAGDVIVGEVLMGDRVVATCAAGYIKDQEALAAASEKRDRLEADWQKLVGQVQRRKPYSEPWDD
jgi:class 3 adenylate cyclase